MTTDDEIRALSEEYWEHHLEHSPTTGHILGDYRRADRFDSATRADEDAYVEGLRRLAGRAEQVADDGLDEQDRLSRDVLVADASARADLTEARLAEIAVDPIFGLQVSLPIMVPMLALPTAEVADALVTKYAGVGRHWRELADRLREGLAAGRTPAEFAARSTLDQLERLLGTPVADDPLMRTSAPPSGLDVDAWKAALREAIEREVRPGMAAYRDVLRDEVLPRSRPDDRAGLSWIPGGEEAYAAALRFFTTTTKSPQEIHDLGRAQVEKLAGEYRALGPDAVGTGDLAEIFEAMRSDPALHFTSGEQLVEASEVAMARAWEAMPAWFETLPQAPCGVQATTTGAKAFYYPPSPDGSRGGTFFVNVEDPESWGVFELESMAFHEGIPGHHLQIAIAGELDSIPDFRKHLRNSAYSEGWGLYTERLSDEMGLYSGPVDRMGMYAADSMRATRLVVDTGMHALGWSRQQGIDYMVENSPLRETMCRPEIDRYLVSPGQATSYMVGRVEIDRMRREAEERQGGGFDVRRFHSAVLDSGALPLGVLDEVVRTRLP